MSLKAISERIRAYMRDHPEVANIEVPSCEELVEMQRVGELPSDEELEREEMERLKRSHAERKGV